MNIFEMEWQLKHKNDDPNTVKKDMYEFNKALKNIRNEVKKHNAFMTLEEINNSINQVRKSNKHKRVVLI